MLALATVMYLQVSCAQVFKKGVNERDAAVLETVERVKLLSAIRAPVLVCGVPYPVSNILVGSRTFFAPGDPQKQIFIVVSGHITQRLTPRALEGLIAHELAHIVSTTALDVFWRPQTHSEYLQSEAAVDAQAALWVGPQALLDAMDQSLVLNYGSPDGNSAAATLEMEYRKSALREAFLSAVGGSRAR